ncbi:hypothetical protein GOV11_00250 [Candidatus Woesearchaeota archaeon]|nr:hypothetical protein [Candidatus Woesearchaeota archaeon]
MALHYIFGAIDILAGVTLISNSLGFPLEFIQAAAALALIVKGIFTVKDILSILDVIIGVVMFVLLWIAAPTLALSLGIYLCIKGAATFA